jgi:hypothetical protein
MFGRIWDILRNQDRRRKTDGVNNMGVGVRREIVWLPKKNEYSRLQRKLQAVFWGYSSVKTGFESHLCGLEPETMASESGVLLGFLNCFGFIKEILKSLNFGFRDPDAEANGRRRTLFPRLCPAVDPALLFAALSRLAFC